MFNCISVKCVYLHKYLQLKCNHKNQDMENPIFPCQSVQTLILTEICAFGPALSDTWFKTEIAYDYKCHLQGTTTSANLPKGLRSVRKKNRRRMSRNKSYLHKGTNHSQEIPKLNKSVIAIGMLEVLELDQRRVTGLERSGI